MKYTAKNIDTEKVLEELECVRKYQEQSEREERIKTEAYYSGVRKGLEIAEQMFRCSNYEKTPQQQAAQAEEGEQDEV
jgi:hypothetical protein